MVPIKESDDEDLSQPYNITCGPIVETVEEECTLKFVYDDAEELFPTTKVYQNFNQGPYETRCG